jgi:hypothetical protein
MPNFLIPSSTDIQDQFHNAQKKDSKFFSVPEGGTLIFFTPANPKFKQIFYKVHKHENLGGGGFFEVCPKRMTNGKEKCPVCDANNELWEYIKNGKNPAWVEEAKKISKEIFAKEMYCYNIIPGLTVEGNVAHFRPKNAEDKAEIRPWVVSPTVHKLIEQAVAFASSSMFDPTCATIMKVTKAANGTYKDGPNAGKPIMHTVLSPAAKNVVLDESLLALLENIPDLSADFKFKPEAELKRLVDAKVGVWRAKVTLAGQNTTVQAVQSVPSIQVAPAAEMGTLSAPDSDVSNWEAQLEAQNKK